MLDLFNLMSTQWRTSMSGPTGLDYGVMYRIMDDMDLTKDRRRELLDDIRVMEGAALTEIHRKA